MCTGSMVLEGRLGLNLDHVVVDESEGCGRAQLRTVALDHSQHRLRQGSDAALTETRHHEPITVESRRVITLPYTLFLLASSIASSR